MILHIIEIFVLTEYDAYVIVNSTKVHKKVTSPKRKCKSHFPIRDSKTRTCACSSERCACAAFSVSVVAYEPKVVRCFPFFGWIS